MDGDSINCLIYECEGNSVLRWTEGVGRLALGVPFTCFLKYGRKIRLESFTKLFEWLFVQMWRRYRWRRNIIFYQTPYGVEIGLVRFRPFKYALLTPFFTHRHNLVLPNRSGRRRFANGTVVSLTRFWFWFVEICYTVTGAQRRLRSFNTRSFAYLCTFLHSPNCGLISLSIVFLFALVSVAIGVVQLNKFTLPFWGFLWMWYRFLFLYWLDQRYFPRPPWPRTKSPHEVFVEICIIMDIDFADRHKEYLAHLDSLDYIGAFLKRMKRKYPLVWWRKLRLRFRAKVLTPLRWFWRRRRRFLFLPTINLIFTRWVIKRPPFGTLPTRRVWRYSQRRNSLCFRRVMGAILRLTEARWCGLGAFYRVYGLNGLSLKKDWLFFEF